MPPQAPYYRNPNLPTQEELRLEQEARLGIEHDSPLGFVGHAVKEGLEKWKAPLSSLKSLLSPAYKALSTAGQAQTTAPSPQQSMAPATTITPPPSAPSFRTPRLGEPFNMGEQVSSPLPGQHDLPMANPSMRVRGIAAATGPRRPITGPLQAMQQRGEEQLRQQPYVSSEELYRSAFNEPDYQTAAGGVFRPPSAQPWAQNQLKEREGLEEFQRLLGMKQQETIGQAEAQLHPSVQAAGEITARQKAYPNQAYAEGLAEQADITAEASLQKAIVDAQKGNIDSLRDLIGPLANAFADIVTGPDEDMAAEAYGVLLDILKRSSGAGAF